MLKTQRAQQHEGIPAISMSYQRTQFGNRGVRACLFAHPVLVFNLVAPSARCDGANLAVRETIVRIVDKVPVHDGEGAIGQRLLIVAVRRVPEQLSEQECIAMPATDRP